jgi:hypothetical protein
MRAAALQTAQIEIRWPNQAANSSELSPVSRAQRFTSSDTWGSGFASTPGYVLSLTATG